jgi:hypothetical protein
MIDIINASDPRVRVELTFHPEGKDPVVVDIPRWDYLDETTVRRIRASLRHFTQDAERLVEETRRGFRRYQIEYKKYEKLFTAWVKRLDDPEVEDPGPEPEEPARPVFENPPDEAEAHRATILACFKEVVPVNIFKLLEKCSTAELAQGKNEWDKHSSIPLGELLASPTSLTGSTERPSSPTSSTEDGTDTTSEADSPGVNSESS